MCKLCLCCHLYTSDTQSVTFVIGTGGPAPHQGNFSGIKYTQKKEPLSIEHSRSGTPSKRDTRPSSRNDSSQMSGLLQHH